ncbi:hypothetical protein GGH95_004736 [Coemansia sp. RSA 1836]|nr:hypothetical protein IWW47_001666 [Coemansia sp. RSA 2052]KAJ2561501.1 hypothetical protein GGH95_004736 [Coemansia sp. RSA 1836]
MSAHESTQTEEDYVFVDRFTLDDEATSAGFARKVYAIVAMQIMSMIAVGASLFYFECTCHFIQAHQWTLRAALAAAALSMAGLSLKTKCQALSVSLLATLVGTLAYFVGASLVAMPDSTSLQTLATTAGMLVLLAVSAFMPGSEQIKAGSVATFALGSINLLSLVHVVLPFQTYASLATTVAAALAFTGHVMFRAREAALTSTANSGVISAVFYTSLAFFNPYVISLVLNL